MSIRISLVCLAVVLCLAGAGCKQENEPKAVAADNTLKNRSDGDPAAKTSFDQSESSSDIAISSEIRRAVMKAEAMSTNGKNCKIITDKGVVTLRGPGDNQAEKDNIGSLAKSAAGVIRVDNQLEVTAP